MNSNRTKPIVIRVVQEDWSPLRNLYRNAGRFSQQTGIEVQVAFSNFEFWWPDLEQAFHSKQPSFDLLGCDEMILWHFAAKGLVEPLDGYIRADGYSLEDYQERALQAATVNGTIYGLPHVFDPNMLLYREDLLAQHGIEVPQTFTALGDAARTLTRENGCGIVLRGSPFESFMECGMSIAASWGVEWFDANGKPIFDTPAHVEALSFWVDLLKKTGPSDVAKFGYEQSMSFFRSGRAAMSIMQISEAAIGMRRGGIVADHTRVALVPSSPIGRRCAGFYGPVYAIPMHAPVPVKRAAWQLAKFLNEPEQLIHDAAQNAFIPTARKSLLKDKRFCQHFRPDLIETFKQSLSCAEPERPRSPFGATVAMVLSRAYHAALIGAKPPAQAIREAQAELTNLSPTTSRAF